MKSYYWLLLFLFFFLVSCHSNFRPISIDQANKTISYDTSKKGVSEYPLPEPTTINNWTSINYNNLAKTVNIKLPNKILTLNKLRILNINGGYDTIQTNIQGSYNKFHVVTNPLLINDQMYLINTNGILSVIGREPKNNKYKIVKQYSVNITPQSEPTGLAYDPISNNIYVIDSAGQVISLYQDGSLSWQTDLFYHAQSAPIIDGKKIYIIANNSVYSLDTLSGDILWQYNGILQGIVLTRNSAPIIYQDFVIAPLSDGTVLLLRKDNGQLIWKTNIVINRGVITNTISASPVIIDNKNILVGSYNSTIASLDMVNGNIVWRNNNMGFVDTPVIMSGHAFFINTDMSLYNISTKDGSVYWSTTLPTSRKNTNFLKWYGPFLVNNQLMVSNSYGDVYLISPYTGEITSSYHLKLNWLDSIGTKPIFSSRGIIFVGEKGFVYILNGI